MDPKLLYSTDTRVDLYLPLKVESGNKMTYGHWSRYYRYKKKWHELIIMLCPERDEPVTGKVRIKTTSVRKRELDKDNLIHGCKPISDALVKAGWLKDDTPDLVEHTIHQVKEKDCELHRGTYISVEILREEE